MNFDKWYEMRKWLETGTEYEALPEDQRKGYELALNKMTELEEIEQRFNGTKDKDK